MLTYFRMATSALVCILTASNGLAQWSGFLGNNGNPYTAADVIPDKFTAEKEGQPAENVAWRRPLPGRSVSGPIIVAGKVITTSSSAMEGRWGHTVAVDAQTGNVVWQRSVRTTGRPYCHPTSANAAPTPCTDGQRVFSFYSANDIVCYDLDGNLQWFRSLVDAHPLAGNDVGMSASPVVADGVVVACVECQTDSFAIGIDAETGVTRWELPRPRKANWSSPVVVTCQDNQTLVVLHSGEGVVAVHPQTGKIAWQLEDRCSTIASAAFADGVLYLPSGGVKAYRIGSADAAPTLLWSSNRINPSTASIAVVKSLGMVGLNRTVLVCCDNEGQMRWQARLADAGQFWSSPLVAGQRLLAADSQGKCFIVDLKEDKGDVISVTDLGAEVLGSPAADSTGIYIRSADALWKLQKP